MLIGVSLAPRRPLVGLSLHTSTVALSSGHLISVPLGGYPFLCPPRQRPPSLLATSLVSPFTTFDGYPFICPPRQQVSLPPTTVHSARFDTGSFFWPRHQYTPLDPSQR